MNRIPSVKRTANFHKFHEVLTEKYKQLFKIDGSFHFVSLRRPARDYALNVCCGLVDGSSGKNSEAIEQTCVELNIEHDYETIREFLTR